MINYNLLELIDFHRVIRQMTTSYAIDNDIDDVVRFVSTVSNDVTNPGELTWGRVWRGGSRLMLTLHPTDDLNATFAAIHQRMEGGR